MYNSLLYASVHYPADKIEDRITFALRHAHLYLAESDDEQDDKSSTKNTFNRSYGGGGSSSSLSSIGVSVSPTSDVVHCWILTSDIFPSNDPLPSDDMVDRDNYPMMLIGGGDTNIDEG